MSVDASPSRPGVSAVRSRNPISCEPTHRPGRSPAPPPRLDPPKFAGAKTVVPRRSPASVSEDPDTPAYRPLARFD